MPKGYDYPDRYEIEQALDEFCSRRFVDQFAQGRGIFITNATQLRVVEFLSGLLYDHSSLEKIRHEAFQFNAKSTLAGFLVISDDDEFDFVATLEDLQGIVVDPKTNMKLEPIIAINTGENPIYKGSVAYTQKRPGRIQFLQGSARSFDYYVHPLGPSRWRMMVDCGRSNDARLMQKWVEKKIPRDARLAPIDQDNLTSNQTIRFFDKLAQQGLDDEWAFTQVTRLVLRRSTDVIEDEEAGVVEAESSALYGITQAILEGQALRNNPFVKESEDGGYRFTAMTYEYEHTKQPHVLEVRADFKRRPKVFEVALEDYKRRTGIEEKLEKADLPHERRIQLLTRFWMQAKYIFDELEAESL